MVRSGFDKLFWGFLFVMIDFRIQGFDIIPDVIGYILFAVGFHMLAVNSTFFKKAENFNYIMVIVSIFYIYEKPTPGGGVSGIHFDLLGILLGLVSLVIGLIVVYHLFMGIKDMASRQEKAEIYDEAGKRWTQYLMLQLAVVVLFLLIFIPPLAIVFIVVLLVVSIVITVSIMKFMRKCGNNLHDDHTMSTS